MKLLSREKRRPAPTYNKFLREHVTRVGFSLTLAKTHIAALVELAEVYDRKSFDTADIETRSFMRTGPHRHVFSHFVSGIRACMDRGLVLHHFNREKSLNGTAHTRDHYTITAAGSAVITLLKESGLYQEYADSLRYDVVKTA